MSTQLHALHVEDTEEDHALIMHELRMGGFDVTVERVETAEDMRAALAKKKWDIVISDHHMPRFDSYGALAVLSESGLDLPFIAVSGTIGEERASELMRQGASDFVLKDNLVRLCPLINRELREVENRRQRREAEKRYRDVVDNALVGVYQSNLQGEILFANQTMAKIYGFNDAVEMVGRNITGHYKNPQDRARLLEILQKDGRISSFETQTLTRSGKTLSVLLSALLESETLSGMIMDITERKQAEDQLRESEEKFKTLFNSANDAIFTMNHTTFLDCNTTTEKIFSCSKDQIVGHSPIDFSPELQPDGSFSSKSAVEKIEAAFSGEPQFFEWLHIRLDGTPFSAEVSLNRVFIGGEYILQAIVRDISERKQAEDQIRLNISRAEALARTALKLNKDLALEVVLNTICTETAAALDVEVVAVDLLDESSGELQCVKVCGAPPGFLARHSSTPRTMFESAEPHPGEALVITDIQAVPGLPNAALYAEFNVRTVVVQEMRRGSTLIGSLSLLTLGQPRDFSADELTLLTGLTNQATQAITNTQLYEETRRRLRNIHSLRAIDHAITSSLDLRLTLNVALEQVVSYQKVDAACVLLLNPYTQTLGFSAGRGFRTKGIERSSVHLGEGQAGRVALERRTAYVPDLKSNYLDSAHADLLVNEDFESYCAMPLIAKGQVKGVLEVYLRSQPTLDAEWLEFLETVAGQIAIAVDNATLFDGLQRSNTDLIIAYDATIEGWSRAMDLRDRETEGHTLRVTETTMQLARAMGIGEEQMVHVRRGALLHDMGKLGVPDGILLKPGPLTDDEWVIMRQHPQFAFDMLSPIAYLRPALDIPYCHHEKWDGSGYPRGLKEEQIPLAARLFAIVDVWDALRSERPYRAAWPDEEVIGYIKSGSGNHFDPKAVEIFLKVLEREAKI
ncbi:MAG: hypothetical protein C0391_09300 [Anaerolinea sp.]|nr:hypothetical protein [Anaerolinea sp.]